MIVLWAFTLQAPVRPRQPVSMTLTASLPDSGFAWTASANALHLVTSGTECASVSQLSSCKGHNYVIL